MPSMPRHSVAVTITVLALSAGAAPAHASTTAPAAFTASAKTRSATTIVTDDRYVQVRITDQDVGTRVSIAARLLTETETAPAGSLFPGSPAQTIAAQAVPSSVTVGLDGALYVGVLRGLPGLPGSAEVYRVVPGQAPVPVVTGLTRVSDLAFTPAGNLLILENNTGGALAPPNTPGALLTATLDGASPVTTADLDVPGLVDPVGLAVDSSGDAYITNHASGAHQGEIIKVSGLG